MATLFVECAVRAALIAGGTAVVLWAMRIKAPATRHAAWTAVVVAMLLLPVWSIAGPKLSLRVLRPEAAPVDVSSTPAGAMPNSALERDAIVPAAPAASEPAPPIDWQRVLVGVYLLGACVLLVRLAIGTLQANRLRRRAMTEDGRATSGRCATPITVGWFSPVLILPLGWSRWPSAQLSAVLTHEAEHARRRDPLVQWVALFNRALFWFHPLAWWLERRLALLAEEACDAAVLAAGHAPHDYSEYLLDLARSVSRQGRRVHVVGVAMPGSGLKPRLRQILAGAPAHPISRGRVACTIAICALSSAIFATGTLAPQTPVSMLTDPHASATVPSDYAQATSAKRFEVASIKPCKGDDLPPGARGSGPGGPSPSPGRLHLDCQPLVGPNGLIRQAYGAFASGVHNAYLHPSAVPVEGGPAWARSDRYTIDAKAEGTPSVEMMRGPMLQALLEDRFQLKVRRETRDVPVYDLTVAKGGSKLKPFDGRCKPLDFTKGDIPAQLEAGNCPIVIQAGGIYSPGQTVGDFITFVLRLLDRSVIDKTGLTGRFDIRLDFASDDSGAITDLTSVLAIAVQQQLGLKLVPARGPGEFLVIDHVERPSSDLASSPAPRAEASVPQASTTASAPARFDVASIKPCADPTAALGRRGGGGAARPAPAAEPAGASASPGRLFLHCQTPEVLVELAYFGQISRHSSVTGGPGWMKSDRFDVEAKAEGAPSDAVMRGPMLQALLEDRFKLKLHRETRDMPVYALTTALSASKLSPLPEGSCAPAMSPPPAGATGRGDPHGCGTVSMRYTPSNNQWDGHGMTVGGFVEHLDNFAGLDRPVVDKTGLRGLFDFHLRYVPDGAPVEADPGPTIFTAVQQQLGLRLEAAKGPGEFLVIDRVERPTPNLSAEAPAQGPLPMDHPRRGQ